MTVFIVTSGAYSNYRIDAVFSTKELAQKFADKQNGARPKKSYDLGFDDGYQVENWEMDSEKVWTQYEEAFT